MKKAALTGIVVCGGKSSRMGTDKSMLQYYNDPQRYHIAQLIQPFCAEVYISLNKNQVEVKDDKYKIIRDKDEFNDLGPMTALLSSYDHLPDKNLLFIGCDYPLLTQNELSLFVRSINETTKAKVFFNETENLYEPLLAYYATSFKDLLTQHFLNGNNSLQQLLHRSDAGKYLPQDKNVLKSVDDRKTFEEVIAMITGK